MQATVKKLEALKAERLAENQMLEAKFNELNLQKAESDQTICNMQNSLVEQKEHIRYYNQQIDGYNDGIGKYGNLMAKFDKENYNLTEDVCKLYFTYKRNNSTLTIGQREKEQLSLSVGKLKFDLANMNPKVAKLEEKNADFSVKLEYLEQSQQTFNIINQNVNEMLKSKDQYRALIVDKEKTIQELKRQNEEALAAIEKNLAEKDDMTRNLKEMVDNADRMLSSSFDGNAISKKVTEPSGASKRKLPSTIKKSGGLSKEQKSKDKDPKSPRAKHIDAELDWFNLFPK